MYRSEKLLQAVLEMQAAEKASRWLAGLMTVTGCLVILAMFLGLSYFLLVNQLHHGDWLARVPWQPAGAIAIWFLGALAACRSDDRHWHTFAAGTLVSGTVAMILFVLFNNPFFNINLSLF